MKKDRLKQPVLSVREDAVTFGLTLEDREWRCQGMLQCSVYYRGDRCQKASASSSLW